MSSNDEKGRALRPVLPDRSGRKLPIIGDVAFVPGRARAAGALILSASLLIGALAYWAVTAGRAPAELWKELPAGKLNLTRIAYSPDGKFLAAGSAAGDLIVWELRNESRTALPSFTDQPITALAVSGGGFLIAGSSDKQLAFVGIPGGQSQALPNFFAPVTSIGIRPGRTEAAVGLADGTLCYLDDSQGKLARGGAGHKGNIKALAYDPAGRLLVAGGSDGRLVWRTTDPRKLTATRSGHSGEVSALSFSPDGRLLASGDWNGEIRLWNSETTEMTGGFIQPDAVSAIGWTQAHLVTGSWDGRLRFWSPQRQLMVQEIDTGRVIHDLAVSPDGDTVATVSDGNRVQLWRAPLN